MLRMRRPKPLLIIVAICTVVAVFHYHITSVVFRTNKNRDIPESQEDEASEDEHDFGSPGDTDDSVITPDTTTSIAPAAAPTPSRPKSQLPASALTSSRPPKSGQSADVLPVSGPPTESTNMSDAEVARWYTPPPQANVSSSGKRFSISQEVIKHMGLPPTSFFTLSPDTVRDFVFVTAADTSHFEESKDCIASIQIHFPGYQIHYYDLGLEPKQRKEMRSWCDVTLHDIDLSVFPAFISRNLKETCWKFLIIQEALRRVHGAVFWVDASFRALRHVRDWGSVFDIALHNGGFVLTNPTGSHLITNYAYTDPRVYDFIPTDRERQKAVSQGCACTMLIYNTEYIYRNVLQWAYLCSLESGCCELTAQARTERLAYQKTLTKEDLSDPKVFKGTRFDQAIVNMVLSNNYNYNITAYAVSKVGFQNIMRYATHLHNVTNC